MNVGGVAEDSVLLVFVLQLCHAKPCFHLDDMSNCVPENCGDYESDPGTPPDRSENYEDREKRKKRMAQS